MDIGFQLPLRVGQNQTNQEKLLRRILAWVSRSTLPGCA